MPDRDENRSDAALLEALVAACVHRGEATVVSAMAMLRQLSPDRGLRSALKALVTDDVELFIFRWRLEIHIDCLKVFLRGPAGSGR